MEKRTPAGVDEKFTKQKRLGQGEGHLMREKFAMKHKKPNRGGFTLTELLVAITILTMLAALSLGALSVVRQSSNVDRTQRTIQKIHLLLMEKLEEYQTKRVKINGAEGRTPQEVIAARTIAIHELMRLEMPDRLSDIKNDPIEFQWKFYNTLTQNWEPSSGTWKLSRPASTERFLRRIKRAPTIEDSLPPGDSVTGVPYENMSAELLYMILMDMPNGQEQFAEYEIGDTNNNGLKEFVDAWGQPIRFLRWAPGLADGYSDIQSNDPAKDHSPFDPYGFYQPITGVVNRGCTLYPFVFSGGPDKKHGVNVESGYIFQGDPYQHSGGTKNNAGEPMSGEEDNYPDNITNHALDFGGAF